jgi:CTP-dependent riboflavin kinase
MYLKTCDQLRNIAGYGNADNKYTDVTCVGVMLENVIGIVLENDRTVHKF